MQINCIGVLMSYESVLKKIVEAGYNEDEIAKKILDKQTELSNLVSKEGAAYIVAKELGLNLIEKTDHKIEIKNIIPGIRALTLTATVSKISPLRTFERDGKEGKVLNLFLADKTGEIRMSLWDEQIELAKDIKENSVIEISGAYTREDKMSGVEIRLGKDGKIKQVDEEPVKFEEKIIETNISELKHGSSCTIRAAVLQMFEPVFYDVCPQCNKSIKEKKCTEHGEVEPKKTVVASSVIDDGYGNMRAVFFRDIAEKFIGFKAEELTSSKPSLTDILGTEFIFTGNVRRNQMFERNEIIINDFKKADPVYESKKIIEQLKGV